MASHFAIEFEFRFELRLRLRTHHIVTYKRRFRHIWEPISRAVSLDLRLNLANVSV